jgi:hypothetical protein
MKFSARQRTPENKLTLRSVLIAAGLKTVVIVAGEEVRVSVDGKLFLNKV